MNEKVELSLRIPSIALESHCVDIPFSLLNSIIKLLPTPPDWKHTGKLATNHSGSGSTATTTKDQQIYDRIRDKIDRSNASRNCDRITAAFYYLETERQVNDLKLTYNEITSLVRGTYNKSSNINRDVRWCVGNSWFKYHSPDEYTLTQEGRDAVQKNFPTTIKQATKTVPSLQRAAVMLGTP